MEDVRSIFKAITSPLKHIDNKYPSFAGGIAAVSVTLTIIYLVMGLPEIPNFLRSVSGFLDDIASIKNLFGKVTDVLVGQTEKLQEATDRFLEYIENEKKIQAELSKKYGLLAEKLLYLIVSSWSSFLDGLGQTINLLIEFGNKNPVFACVVLLLLGTLFSGALSFVLVFTGKAVGLLSTFYKIITGVLAALLSFPLSPMAFLKKREGKDSPQKEAKNDDSQSSSNVPESVPEAERAISTLDYTSKSLIEYGEHLSGLTGPIRRFLSPAPDPRKIIETAFSDYNARFTTETTNTLNKINDLRELLINIPNNSGFDSKISKCANDLIKKIDDQVLPKMGENQKALVDQLTGTKSRILDQIGETKNKIEHHSEKNYNLTKDGFSESKIHLQASTKSLVDSGTLQASTIITSTKDQIDFVGSNVESLVSMLNMRSEQFATTDQNVAKTVTMVEEMNGQLGQAIPDLHKFVKEGNTLVLQSIEYMKQDLSPLEVQDTPQSPSSLNNVITGID